MFTKTTKTLVAALVLAGASITFVANAYAAPRTAPYSGLPNGGFGCDPDYGPNGYNPCADAGR